MGVIEPRWDGATTIWTGDREDVDDEWSGSGLRRLEGRAVLVVGGGTDGDPLPGEKVAIGNGRATCVACAREGASVMVADLKLERAQETVELIHEEGGVAEAIACDASREEDCRAAVEATVAAFGRLQCLVNVPAIVDRQTIF